MLPTVVLISHVLCPYVQRVAIVLAEKGVLADRIDIDLSNKPGWFLSISPTGKTPVLLVNDEAIFESSAICEFLEDAYEPPMHPEAPLARAQHRAWMEFASGTLAVIADLYSAGNEEDFNAKTSILRARFAKIDIALAQSTGAGPYFGGASLALVDAAFAPVFRYFDVFDHLHGLNFLESMPAVMRWRTALHARPSVRDAIAPAYPAQLRTFLMAKKTVLARLLE